MGWPKGKPRKPQTIPDQREPIRAPKKVDWQMKAGARWDNESFDDSNDSVDRLHIPQDMIPEGMDMQWVTDSVFGHPETQHRTSFEKRGWTPVHPSDFDGRFDGKFGLKGATDEINVGGLVLMARPLHLSIKSRARELRDAQMQIAIKEQALRGGDLPISLDPDHPSAVKSNRINKSYERIEIPKDEE